jgi:signal transduction histidine kinase
VNDGTLLSPAFLERAAHDIRGPAGVVSYVIDEITLLAERGVIAPELVDRAKRGLQRLLRVADRLSRAAQLESGGLALERERLELRGLVRECVAEARRIEPRGEVAVELADAPVNCPVEADARWLGAALTDVLVAAIRRARAFVGVELLSSEAGPSVVVRDDGVRSSLPADVFADLPFALARATLARHGWQLCLEDPPVAERGMLHGGRVVISFSGALP